jgi:hypothetical protein
MKTLLVAGMFTSMIAGVASADMLYYTSFEDPNYLGGKYFDTGDAATSHWLVNNAGEAAVNGDGFSAWYGSTGGVGLTDGDYVGVTTYIPGGVGSYDGVQHYQMSDTDGIMELHFDGYDGEADSVSIAIFVRDTGYEADDTLSIHWGDGDLGGGPLYELLGTGGDGNGSDLEDASGTWMFLEFDVSGLGGGHLHVRFESNSSNEAVFIDSVSIMGSVIPAPSALALLGLAGIAGRRRRR